MSARGGGGLGVVVGLDEKISFLLSASLCCTRIGGYKFYFFSIEPLSSDVKANYIYHSHFEKLGDVIIHPVLVVA